MDPILRPRPLSAKGRVELFAERRAGLRKTLARGRQWLQRIKDGPAYCAADIARAEGLTRTRVSQILKLLLLAPSILADLEDPAAQGPVPTEAILRKLADESPEEFQVRKYQRLVASARKPILERKSKMPLTEKRPKGFQHHFAKARKLKEMLGSGEYISIRELADAAGISTAWVAHLLNLTELAPDLIKQLDVPHARVPAGFSVHDLRVLARIKNHDEQRETFEAMVRGGKVEKQRKPRQRGVPGPAVSQAPNA